MRLAIIALYVITAVIIAGVYGALHDQISFTVSPEYFTRFKFQQFGLVGSELPDRVKVALIGVLATWWMGIPIGLVVGTVGLIHSYVGRSIRYTFLAFVVVAIVALLIGLLGLGVGFFFANPRSQFHSNWYIPDGLESPRRYLAVGYMHLFSYLGGVAGILVGVVFQLLKWKSCRHHAE